MTPEQTQLVLAIAMVLLTGALVGVTIWYAASTRRIAKGTRELADATVELAHDTRRMADETEKMADATVTLAQETAEQAQDARRERLDMLRPVLGIWDPRRPVAGGAGHLTFNVANVGRGPAWDVRFAPNSETEPFSLLLPYTWRPLEGASSWRLVKLATTIEETNWLVVVRFIDRFSQIEYQQEFELVAEPGSDCPVVVRSTIKEL